MIALPLKVVFEEKTYVYTGKILRIVNVQPDGLGFIGAVTPQNDEPPVPVQPSNGRVFSIEGVDKDRAIAVRIESRNGELFYYLEYQADE